MNMKHGVDRKKKVFMLRKQHGFKKTVKWVTVCNLSGKNTPEGASRQTDKYTDIKGKKHNNEDTFALYTLWCLQPTS